MVFKSARQRRAFFATGNFARSPVTPSSSGFQNNIAFSYRDGKRLGRFKNINEVFKKFPSERKAFERVVKFRRKTGMNVNSINEIKNIKRNEKNNPSDTKTRR